MNKRFCKSWIVIVCMIPPIFLANVPLLAEEQTTKSFSGQAITIENPEIAIDELELRLKPLTRDELEIEVEALVNASQGHGRGVDQHGDRDKTETTGD